MSHTSPDPPSLDVLAIGAHPDDVELSTGGTLTLLAQRGYRTGIVHLTRGECGTRGTPEIREQESLAAAKILKAQEMVGLNMGDGRLENSDDNRRVVVELLRRLRPTVVITHYSETRHPDHIAVHSLVRDCCFLANVGGYTAAGERHKVKELVYYLAHEMRETFSPDWIVDVTPVQAIKLQAVEAYQSQFYSATRGLEGPQTLLSSPEFWRYLENRSQRWGYMIGARDGEPFVFQNAPHAGHAFVRMFV